ncbi:MAG: hypothetical protein NTV25_08620 [Methanothrix sp.]|nr:hypothetical protein [Methanothrix sp.]
MTDIISAYGAVIGTVSLLISAFLAYLRYKEKKPQLIAKIREDTEESKKIIISAINNGLTKVSLEECKIELANQFQLKVQLVDDYKQFYQNGFFSRSNLLSEPYELLPGKRYDIAIFKNDIYLALIKNNILHGKVKLLSHFKDEVENIYKSQIYEFDLDDYEISNLNSRVINDEGSHDREKSQA